MVETKGKEQKKCWVIQEEANVTLATSWVGGAVTPDASGHPLKMSRDRQTSAVKKKKKKSKYTKSASLLADANIIYGHVSFLERPRVPNWAHSPTANMGDICMRFRRGNDLSSGETGSVSHWKSLCEQLTGRAQGQELKSVWRMFKQLLNNWLPCFSNVTHAG